MAQTLSRVGQVNASGDNRALHLKKFSGEVITQFRETFHLDKLHTVRNVGTGKSWQFPIYGKATAGFFQHGTGATVTSQTIKKAEKEIFVDSTVLAAASVADIDKLLSHTEDRMEFARELAQAIRRHEETYQMYALIKGGYASNIVDGAPSGAQVEFASGATTLAAVTAADVEAVLYDARKVLNENDVPKEDRYCLVHPEIMDTLLQTSTKALNRDYNSEGSFAAGVLPRIAGINLVESNNIPTNNVSTNPTGAVNDYTVDCSDTGLVVFHKSAIGTVRRKDLTIETDWIPDERAWLVQAVALSGSSYLRPESIVIGELADP